MSDIPTELSENQKAALGKPCRKCGKDGTVHEKTGRFGPWVVCSECGDKVRRPRGITAPGARGSNAQPGAQPGHAAGVQAGSLEASIIALVQPAIDAALQSVQVDASEVLSVVQAELAKVQAARPQVIEVVQPDRPAVQIEGAHYLMPRLLRLLGAGLNVYLWGPAGSGKTTAALQAAKALSREAEIDTLDRSTFRSMVQGYCSPDGKPVHTSFTRCWEGGKVYVADEVDNAPGHVQTLYNSALANGHAPLAWGNVTRPDGFAFVGTGNTPGRPTREFPDRVPMSAAFLDRLYFMHWPIDEAIEQRAAGLAVTPAPVVEPVKCSDAAWGEYVLKLRAWAKDNAPTLMITPRATLVGLQALALGETPAQVADALIFRGADSELRAKACAAVAVPA